VTVVTRALGVAHITHLRVLAGLMTVVIGKIEVVVKTAELKILIVIVALTTDGLTFNLGVGGVGLRHGKRPR